MYKTPDKQWHSPLCDLNGVPQLSGRYPKLICTVQKSHHLFVDLSFQTKHQNQITEVWTHVPKHHTKNANTILILDTAERSQGLRVIFFLTPLKLHRVTVAREKEDTFDWFKTKNTTTFNIFVPLKYLKWGVLNSLQSRLWRRVALLLCSELTQADSPAQKRAIQVDWICFGFFFFPSRATTRFVADQFCQHHICLHSVFGAIILTNYWL